MHPIIQKTASVLLSLVLVFASFSSSVAFASPVQVECSDTQTQQGNHCVDIIPDHNGDGHQDNGNGGSHDNNDHHDGDNTHGDNNHGHDNDNHDNDNNHGHHGHDGHDGDDEDGDDDGGPVTPPVVPTTITIDASNVVCTNVADLPVWGTGGHGPISATTAKDWVAAHSSCSLTSGWSFEYTDQAIGYAGDATVGHVNGYTTFGPTGTTGSTTTTFTLAGTKIEIRSVLQDGFVPFTYVTDATNGTMPSAQLYCDTDALNLDNSDFIYSAVAGTTYYCVAFNAVKPVVVETPATTTPETPAATTTPEAPTVTTPTTGGGGGGGVVLSGPLSIGYVNTNSGGGVVLGTSTQDSAGLPGGCTALLTTYMRQGHHNDKSEVTKLQNFLNTHLGLSIPVTGYFGSATTAGVNTFQAKYQKDVLSPWAPFGYNANKPTGYVYKTTQHQVNLLACATLNAPFPQLP